MSSRSSHSLSTPSLLSPARAEHQPSQSSLDSDLQPILSFASWLLVSSQPPPRRLWLSRLRKRLPRLSLRRRSP